VRAARSFSSVDWTDVTSKLSTDAAKSEINRLRAVYGEQAALANTFSGPPAPIDFSAYAGKVDAEFLAEAEKSFNSFMSSDAKPEFKFDTTELAATVAKLDAALKDAGALVEESAARISELEAEVAVLEAKMTSEETTVTEILDRYPGMEAEIDQEIAQFNFKKDT